MTKQLKVLTLLFFVAAVTFTFTACGDKDNDSDKPSNTDDSALVADTQWIWMDENTSSTGIIDVRVEFNGPRLASVITTDMSTGIMDVAIYQGTYTYSGGNGTLSLRDDDTNAPVNATFSVNGNTMTLNFKNKTYSLTKRQ